MSLTSYCKFLIIFFSFFFILVGCQGPNMNVYKYDEVVKRVQLHLEQFFKFVQWYH